MRQRTAISDLKKQELKYEILRSQVAPTASVEDKIGALQAQLNQIKSMSEAASNENEFVRASFEMI